MAILRTPHQPTGGTAPPAQSLASRVFPDRLGISPDEFADATHTGRTTVYLALQRGEIPHRRIGRRIIIPLSVLDQWFAHGEVA